MLVFLEYYLRTDLFLPTPLPESIFAAFSLEGSGISFADLFRLIAFYCISR